MELARGAEAVLVLSDGAVEKCRVKKGYRLPVLDERIRRERTRMESRMLERAGRAGIPVPRVLRTEEHLLVMEAVEGVSLADVLDEQPELARQVGASVLTLHEANIIHGDLTTSNLIYDGRRIWFIDFGLAFHSRRVEDKAVDIHVFKQALESRHSVVSGRAFTFFLEGYTHQEVVARLRIVASRGRNKR